MHYSQGDLAILSAETYDPGNKLPAAISTSRKAAQPSQNSRKRKSSPFDSSPEQEEEEKKRTRGRPRLDTKDETAAEVSMPSSYLIDIHG